MREGHSSIVSLNRHNSSWAYSFIYTCLMSIHIAITDLAYSLYYGRMPHTMLS